MYIKRQVAVFQTRIITYSKTKGKNSCFGKKQIFSFCFENLAYLIIIGTDISTVSSEYGPLR